MELDVAAVMRDDRQLVLIMKMRGIGSYGELSRRLGYSSSYVTQLRHGTNVSGKFVDRFNSWLNNAPVRSTRQDVVVANIAKLNEVPWRRTCRTCTSLHTYPQTDRDLWIDYLVKHFQRIHKVTLLLED